MEIVTNYVIITKKVVLLNIDEFHKAIWYMHEYKTSFDKRDGCEEVKYKNGRETETKFRKRKE